MRTRRRPEKDEVKQSLGNIRFRTISDPSEFERVYNQSRKVSKSPTGYLLPRSVSKVDSTKSHRISQNQTESDQIEKNFTSFLFERLTLDHKHSIITNTIIPFQVTINTN